MDMISSGRDRADSSRSGLVHRSATVRGLPVTAGVALLAVLLGFLIGRLSTGGLFGGGTVGDLTGSMVLELQPGAYVERPSPSDQAEYRGEDWKGTIAVEGSGEHTGAARLRGSASYVPTDSGPVVAHMWGTAEVTLDGQSCTGTYGYSAYRNSDEGGGSMHLRCDQGSVLGATMTAGGAEPPSGTQNWTITIALTEGYLLSA